MWERFSFYGMKALLILFMTASLEHGGLGFGVGKSGAVYGMYTAMVYLCSLPGGSANVFGRLLGIPGDLVDATEHLLGLADDWRSRRVDLGVVNGRCFTFASGLGLDASVVERVDANPQLKARLGPYYFTWVAISTFTRRYLLRPARLEVESGRSPS